MNVSSHDRNDGGLAKITIQLANTEMDEFK